MIKWVAAETCYICEACQEGMSIEYVTDRPGEAKAWKEYHALEICIAPVIQQTSFLFSIQKK